jgi:hypothetical protein
MILHIEYICAISKIILKYSVNTINLSIHIENDM